MNQTQNDSSRSCLTLKTTTVKNLIKRNRQMNKVTKGSVIAITASVEYFIADIIDSCLALLEEKGKSTIKPDYIIKAVNKDQEMA